MIFYILTAAALAWIVVIIVRGARRWRGFDLEDDGAPIFGVIVAWGFVACFVLSFAQAGMPATYTDIDRRGLTALANRTDQPGGYFFLGTGVVDEEEVYRYIERDAEGGNRMKDVRVYMAVVYETAESPHMETVTSYGHRWWMTPWPVRTLSSTEYRFHIPEGSIARSFEVKP